MFKHSLFCTDVSPQYEKSMAFDSLVKMAVCIGLVIFLSPIQPFCQNNYWENVSRGLSIGTFPVEDAASGVAATVIVVKIDPHLFAFKLLSAKELNLNAGLPVDEWCEKYNLIAAINAGMYQTDYLTNVGYMKNFTNVNNPSIHRRHFSVFAFNPINERWKEAAIYDIDLVKMADLIKNYNTVIQNLRLIKKNRENKWSGGEKSWSEAALGSDNRGNILFIICKTPFTMQAFNSILLRLPINLVNAQHLEGGSEASLYLNHSSKKIQINGSYGLFIENLETETTFMPLPNIIGIVKK
ncbi:MAG: phosphodiester glycosidase family protein [Chitinivibrionales bacterium]|nr:phosphodiester glycosidase family protein [Chitinivibrionales bacterium]